MIVSGGNRIGQRIVGDGAVGAETAITCVPGDPRAVGPTSNRALDAPALLNVPHFQIASVSINTGGLASARYVYSRFKIKLLSIYLDPNGSAVPILNLQRTPLEFLIGPDGKAIGLQSGVAVWDSPSMVKLLTHVTSSKSPH